MPRPGSPEARVPPAPPDLHPAFRTTPDGSCQEWEDELLEEALMHAALDRILERGGPLRAAIRDRIILQGDYFALRDLLMEDLCLIQLLRIGPAEAGGLILMPSSGRRPVGCPGAAVG